MSADRDVVYILKAAEQNDELRHSLRSVAEHLPHRRVWVVGYRPRWLADDVGYVPVIQRGVKHANTWANWVAAARCPGISDTFYLFNDDFYVTKPIEEVPILHRGTLDDAIDWYGRLRMPSHRQRAALTRQLLGRHHAGSARPHSYELHLPLPVHRSILGVCVDWLTGQRGIAGHDVVKRTFYANFAHYGGEQARDVKVMGGKDGLPEGSPPFLSTSPQSWAGLAGGWVRQRWPEPCRYERVLSHQTFYRPDRSARG